ncbi:MAG: PadR family transcriptional regulator [Rhodothermales bacterium]
MELLTRSEELLLLTVWNLQEEAYGAAIRELLSVRTGYEWAIGSVYGPLDRLAKQGLLTTHTGLPTPERGGRSKRCYRLTPKGVGALGHTRHVVEAFWQDARNAAIPIP